MSAGADTVQLAPGSDGRCAVSGALTMATAPQLWRALRAGGLLSAAREADLSGVTASDSAGLALLVAWRASCLEAGADLKLVAVPARLRALAALTGAESVLSA